jgi:hypothetical protein
MKVKKRILSKGYYTPPEINDYIGSNRIPYHNLLYTYLASALSKLPKHIVDKVLKKCIFITFSGWTKGCCVPPSLNNKTLIYISWYHLKRAKPDTIEHTILHEIAHWFLKHNSSLLLSSHLNFTFSEINKQEKEADYQVKKWLQEYDNTPVC